MKRLILSIVTASLLAACGSKPQTRLQAIEYVKGTAVYGDSVKNENVIDYQAIPTAMKHEDEMDLKIKGLVSEVCNKKGCWLSMKLENGQEMRVTFKDARISVPANLKGKEVILDGLAYVDTISIEKQKHYAEDAGKAPEDIAKITSPKRELAFQATGLVVLN